MSSALAHPPAKAVQTPLTLDPDITGQIFDLIGRSALVRNGQAMLVSIAPIKAALGERWPSRREQIYGLTERHLRRRLAPGDICQRAGETYFLVATPELAPVVAQAVCYRALMEVLAHFLGEAKPSDLQVSQVAELDAGHVRLRPFSVAELRKADAEALPKPASSSSLSSLASWPLEAADGQGLRVSFAVDPVMDLKAWAMAGHRIESRIFNQQTDVELTGVQRRRLLPHDFERIDLAALERGLSRLDGLESFDRPRLIVQLSFASLSNSRARAALLSRARELQHVLRHAAMCELVDVEAGVPVGRLSEVTSLIRGAFRSVWVQVELSRTAIETACAAKVSGLTVKAVDLGEDNQAIANGMRAFVQMVKKPGMLLTVTSLPTNDLLIDAMAAGFTHATLRARRSPTPKRLPPPLIAD